MAKNKLDGMDYRIVRELANNGMRVPPVADIVYLHRATVYTRIEKIERITGLNPLDFWDLCELVKRFEGVNLDA